MKDSIIEKYNLYKQKLNNVENTYGLKLGTVLSERIWKVLKVSKVDVFVRILYNIFFDQYYISSYENADEKNIVVFIDDFRKTREDHQTIFNNACSLVHNYQRVVLKKTKKFTIIKFYKRAKLVKEYYKKFDCFSPIIMRFYISSMMCVIDDLYNMICSNRLLENKKNMLIFQDCDLVSNIFVQLMQMRHGITVELQHGQWLYRNEPYDDYLNIANFTADYFLAWNEFTKQQFLNAGYDEQRIKVVGSTKYMYESEMSISEENKKGVFGVVLDTPAYVYSEKYNKMLLDIAENIAGKINYKYYIKIHPFDDADNYKEYMESQVCIGCVERSASMKAYSEMVDFSLGHTTGASVDLMILNSFVFLYKTEINYPLITNPLFEFRNDEDLLIAVQQVLQNWALYKEQYKEVRAVYHTENALQNHQQFFDEIFNKD
ncbi:MAG: hypothetical protein ACI4DS_07935 [Eubacterium sp.]